MKLRKVLNGLATYIPGLSTYDVKGTGGTNSARYCYSVWLRHLVMAAANGLPANPQAVAELGPGDSVGIGLAALLTGAESYRGFDAFEHASLDGNRAIFEELVVLCAQRTPIPDDDEFPRVSPALERWEFPAQLLTESRMAAALAPARLDRIRAALSGPTHADSMIAYAAPWEREDVVREGSVDMILSQAVLEHVEDLPLAYRAMHRWLTPGGFVSHQIDFKSHAIADEWNGHWGYDDLSWSLVRGRRPYFINRQPHSVHVQHLEQSGFSIVCDRCQSRAPELARERLAPRFRTLSEQDLTTSGAFIQAIKRGG